MYKLEEVGPFIEDWRSVKNYEGKYEVSSYGRVKSLNYKGKRKEGILKTSKGSNGYKTFGASLNGKQNTISVHQTVAESFLNHTPDGHKIVVDHINDVKTDNRLENLRLVTQRENTNKKHLKSTSIHTGVSWNKGAGKWVAYISHNQNRISLGSFTDEIKASEAYQDKLKELGVK